MGGVGLFHSYGAATAKAWLPLAPWVWVLVRSAMTGHNMPKYGVYNSAEVSRCYTRMLRAVLNISKNEHVSNNTLYEGIDKVSEKVAARRMRLAGHCHRHQELPASHLVLWEPTHGHRSRGRPTWTYVNVLKDDARVQSTSELAGCMENRDDWKQRWKARLRTT